MILGYRRSPSLFARRPSRHRSTCRHESSHICHSIDRGLFSSNRQQRIATDRPFPQLGRQLTLCIAILRHGCDRRSLCLCSPIRANLHDYSQSEFLPLPPMYLCMCATSHALVHAHPISLEGPSTRVHHVSCMLSCEKTKP